MPIFIPDRLKTPGEFPSIDANDNQIRGFGFFADNNARTALSEDFRCQGYLAFMKNTLQFKQYESRFNTDEDWGNDANWSLLEGTTTDTYWSADSDGTGIYYSNQVIVGGSTYGGDEKLYVNGDAKISGYLVASEIQSESGIDFKIDTNASGGVSEDFAVKYNNGSDTYRDAFIAKPFAATPNIAFGNIFDDFKLDHYSSSFSEFRTLSASINETGFKFTDFGGQDGVMLFRMRTDESYLELSDGGRKISTSPHTYKIFSTVEADATVTHSVEMLMPDSATGDWTFNHLGNKNYVFNTNTDSSSKLITKFHAQGNGVVSIGTANYYNEYNGIQYPTYSSNIQPRLFIVNDQGSSTGVRVQSGDTTLGTSAARTQPRFFTDMRDDGFYISRTTTGPVYDETAAEGEEWDGSGAGTPSASSGISRGDGFGNQMNIFARSGIDFKVNNEDVFGVLGGGNESVSDNHGFYLSNHSESATTATMSVYARPDGTFDFSSSIIGKFLQVFSTNTVGFDEQGIQVYGRGIDSRSKSFGNPESNTTPPLRVYSLLGNSDNTGYWWGADGESYDTQAELLAAGTTVDTEKLADQVAIYVPKHGSGKVGIGTTSPSQKLHVVGSMYLADSAADGNTLIGSGWSSLTGKNNTAVGYQALESLTTNSYNTAVGYQAQKNFTGQQSVAVGFRAGQNATGSHTCVGYAAGQSISGGTYVGHTAGSGSAVDSTVVGKESYRNVSSGGSDVIVGHQVMWSDKTSKNTASNISIGNAAQYFAGTDSYNVAIGETALRGNEQGDAAGYLNRTKNIALGHGSMYRAYSGANNNIVLGYQAAYSQQIATDEGDLSTVTFANNVFIGYQSAYDITSGSRNVAIGEQSAYNLTEGSGNVLIGYMAGYNLTTESNRLYIANSNADTPLIYGDFSTGDVGIGTTSPQGKLHVAGIGLFDDSVNIYRSNNSWSRTMLMFSRLDENSVKKNVGHIGTAVNGNITAEKGYRFYFSNQARGANNYAKQHLAILENGDVEIKNTSSESSSNLEGDARLKVVGGTSDDTKNALSVNASDNSSLLLVRNDGNVGIGTTNPTAKLYVDGDARVNGTFYTLNGLQNFANRADMSFLNATNNTGYLRFITQRDGSQNESLRITNVGNVGVGTTAPSSKLHVYGNVTGDEGNQGKLRVYGSPPAAEDSEETIYGSTTWSPGGSIEIGRIVNGSAVTPGLTLNGHSSSAGSSSGTAARANIYKHGSILDVGFSGGSGSRIAPVFNEVYSLGSTGRKWLELHYTSSYSSWVVSGLQSSSNLAAITYANRRGHDKFYPTAVDIGSRTTSIVANGGITINPKFVYRDAYTNVSDNPASTTSGGLGRGIASDVTSINGVGFDDQTTDLNDPSNYNTGVYVSNPTYYILSYSGGDFTTDSDDGAVDYLRVEVSSNGSIRGIQPCDSSGNWKSSSIGSGFRIGDKISFPAGFAGAGSESVEVTLKPFTGLEHDSFSASDPGLSISDGGSYTHKIKAGGIRGLTGLFATYQAGITVDDILDDLQGFNGGLSLSVEEDGQISVLPSQSFLVKARDMYLTANRIDDGVNETQWVMGRSGIFPAGSDRKSVGLDGRSGVRWFRYGADSGSKYIITSNNPITGSAWSSNYTFSDSDLPDPVNETSVITYGANTYKIQNPHGNISSIAGSGENGGVHGFQLSVGIGGFIDTYTSGGVERSVTRKVQVVPLIKGWGGNANGLITPDGDGYASVVIGKDDEFIFDDHGDIICTIPEKGIVLTAPNNAKYRILVGNGGVIFSEAYTAPSAYTD